MGKMSTKQLQIAEIAKRYCDVPLSILHHYIDYEWLEWSMSGLKAKASAGVDGKLLSDYQKDKHERLAELLSAFKSGKYRAPPVKRVYIDKGGGKRRPLGIPTIEDKLLQNAVKNVIEPVYELIFHDFSFGFRPHRSQHDAIRRIWGEINKNCVKYILDCDIQDYFGSIDHGWLREFLDKRVTDGVIRRQIHKWLKAGVFEDGLTVKSKSGTPQGGIISPLLSNIYLHEVLDEWFCEIKPMLKGKCFLVRYADDSVLGFEHKEDAERVYKVIFKRFAKYGLTLHPDKTNLIEFKRRNKGNTFDFLGFTFYWGVSRKGNLVLKHKTSSKGFTKAVNKFTAWMKVNRHTKIKVLIAQINVKLRGHYEYFGITFNSRSINKFYTTVKRVIFKWLNRRGGKNHNWIYFTRLVDHWLPLIKPKIYHSYW